MSELEKLDDDDLKQLSIFKNYDIVVDISYFYNLEKNPWVIKIGDDQTNNDLSKINWKGLVITFLGLFNKGKTFVLNNLVKTLKEKYSELKTEGFIESSTVNTEGLSFKFVDCKSSNDQVGEEYIFLDTAGLQSPIMSEEQRIEINEEEEETSSGSSEDEENTSRKRIKKEKRSFLAKIREKKILELFLNDLIFELSDFFLVIVEHLTTTDQEFVENLINKLGTSKSQEFKKIDRIHIIHNFSKITSIEEAQKLWKKEVLNVYKDGKLAEDGICYLFRKNKHVFLINNDCDEGKEHNKKVFKLLLSWIKNDYPVGRQYKLIENIEKKISTVLKQYMNNIEGVKYNDNNKTFDLKKLKSEDSIKMNEIAIDVLTGLKISHTDEFSASYDIYKMEREKDNEIVIKIDLPDLADINTLSKRRQSKLISNPKIEEKKRRGKEGVKK